MYRLFRLCKYSFFPAVSFALLGSSVRAQEGGSRVDEIVVISSRVPQPLSRVATSVSVITEKDLALRTKFSLVDVLRQLPSVSSSANGGLGSTTALRIRGEESFRTLAMVDGIRITDPSGPQLAPQLEHVMTSGISRVEVLRGPQGLAYGADAGGVINISTTPSQAGLQGTIQAQAGSFGTRSLEGKLAASDGDRDFALTVADLSSTGFNTRTNDVQLQDDDGYDNTTVHLRAGASLGSGWKAELVHRRVEGETRFDACGFVTPQHDCLALFDQRASRVALKYQGSVFNHNFAYATTRTDRDSLTAGASVFATQGMLQRWEYLGSAAVDKSVTVLWGADHERDGIAGVGRVINGVFAEVVTTLAANWLATAGFRHDHNQSFGNNDSYRVTTAYLIESSDGSMFKLKGSLGTGFRAPSPYEDAYNRGPFASPPASRTQLQQERSKGYEVGAEFQHSSGARAEVVYFSQQIDEAIEFDLGTFSGYLQYQGTSRSTGVEVIGSLPLTPALALQANATWNDSEKPDGQQRLRRPRLLANAGMRWQASSSLELFALGRLSGDYIDQDYAGIRQMEGFVVADVGGTFQINQSVNAFLRIDNIFDRRYQEVLGYNTAGRSVFLGVQWRFADR